MTSDADRVSVVIPARNAAGTLGRCLESLRSDIERGTVEEVVVVDDGSTDRTAAIAAERGARVLAGPGRGPGPARNVGWRATGTALVWFVDADCVVDDGALDRLRDGLDDERVAAVGGSYTNLHPRSILARVVHEEIRSRHRSMSEDVDYLASFHVLYRRRALETVDGFDESLFFAEDADLSFRLIRAGMRLRFDPESTVGHHHPTRLLPYLRSQATHGDSATMMYLRHPAHRAGNSYARVTDHAQPVVAALSVPALATLAWSGTAAWAAVLPAAVAACAVPRAWAMARGGAPGEALAFLPISFVRAYARAWGMAAAALRALFGSRRAAIRR